MMRHQTYGTFDHPHSALNLRLALATFGLINCLILLALSLWLNLWVLAVIAGALVPVTVVDLVVIQRRRRARHRAHPGVSYSLFE